MRGTSILSWTIRSYGVTSYYYLKSIKITLVIFHLSKISLLLTARLPVYSFFFRDLNTLICILINVIKASIRNLCAFNGKSVPMVLYYTGKGIIKLGIKVSISLSVRYDGRRIHVYMGKRTIESPMTLYTCFSGTYILRYVFPSFFLNWSDCALSSLRRGSFE